MSVRRPGPVLRELVPPVAPVAPPELAVHEERLLGGLPHRIELAQGVALLVVLPTGVVSAWRDADPAAVVSDSTRQLSPVAEPTERRLADLGAPALRLLVEIDGASAACLPPVVGLRRRAARLGVVVELVALAWRIHAGTVMGVGDFGSGLRVAWRRLGAAAAEGAPS